MPKQKCRVNKKRRQKAAVKMANYKKSKELQAYYGDMIDRYYRENLESQDVFGSLQAFAGF